MCETSLEIWNFLDQTHSFEIAQFLAQELKFYDTFTSQKFLQMEEEFLLLQSGTLQDFDDLELFETTIKTDEDGDGKTYRTDI